MNRAVAALLREVARGEIGPAVQARAVELLEGKHKKGPKKEKPRSLSYQERREAQEREAEAVALTIARTTIFRLNITMTAEQAAPCGRCDCGCGGAFCAKQDGEYDHWIERSQGGGHEPENGWRLLSECHDDKTNNRPDRATWNEKRRAYCERTRFPFVERRERP